MSRKADSNDLAARAAALRQRIDAANYRYHVLDEPDIALATDGKRRLIAPRWRR